jgi:hypothetical protein
MSQTWLGRREEERERAAGGRQAKCRLVATGSHIMARFGAIIIFITIIKEKKKQKKRKKKKKKRSALEEAFFLPNLDHRFNQVVYYKSYSQKHVRDHEEEKYWAAARFPIHTQCSRKAPLSATERKNSHIISQEFPENSALLTTQKKDTKIIFEISAAFRPHQNINSQNIRTTALFSAPLLFCTQPLARASFGLLYPIIVINFFSFSFFFYILLFIINYYFLIKKKLLLFM